MVAAVAVVLSVVSMVLAAPARSYEDLLEEGAQAAEDGRYEDSFGRLAASYDAMPQSVQVSDVGRFVVEQALVSFELGPQRPEDIHRAIALIERYLRALGIARDAGMATTATGDLDRLNLRRLDLIRRIDPAPSFFLKSRVRPANEHPSVPREDVPASERRESIALLAVGSVLVAGGIPFLVQGLRFPSLIEGQEREALAAQRDLVAEDPTWRVNESGIAEHAASQRRIGHALTGVGVGLIAVGSALTLWGGLRMRKRRGTALSAAGPGMIVVRF